VSGIICWGVLALAENDESNLNEKQALEVDQIKKRLDMLDRRLDNIDSVVSAVAERVMKQPITFNVTCSKCGQKIEIAIIGTEKPSR
jgi:tRNA(Ser,Leu) C12 N-acetylase TAN1